MSKEYVQVVDIDDKPIEVKDRYGLSDADIIRVSVLWVEDGRGNVLIQQRSLTKKLGAGQWQTAVAGTVGANESYLDNVKKETREEIGLEDVNPTEVAKKYIASPTATFGRIIMFYHAVCNKPTEAFTLEVGEAEQLKWIDKSDLLDDVDNNPDNYVQSASLWREVYTPRQT